MSYEYKYPRPMVTVDALVFANDGLDLNVLLIKRGNPPFKGKWALPGGFVDMDETLDHAVVRELEEEAGIRIDGFQQLYTFGNPERDPRGRNITVVFLKEISEKIYLSAGDDAAEAGWFDVKNLPELAFDHYDIIALGIKKLIR